MLGPNKLLGNLTIFKNKKSRDGLNSIFCGKGLLLVDIDFTHHHFSSVIFRNLLEQR